MRAADGLIIKSVGEELLLLDVGRGVYHNLDAVGARIWQLITADHSLDAVIEMILEEYEVEREQLRTDIEELLAELRQRGLLL